MTATWFRRVLLSLACATATLLAACGSGSTVDPFVPTRIIVFGDAFSDVGQSDGKKYTVNDGSPANTVIEKFAANFGFSATTAVASGALANTGAFSYAQGNARVESSIGSAGATVPSVAGQIDQFLASSNTFAVNDLVVITAGIGDISANVMRYLSYAGLTGADASLTAALGGAITKDQMSANIAQAGVDLANQVVRLTQRGAKHVLVVGAYNLGRSPWAIDIGQQSLLQDASTGIQSPCNSFNCRLAISLFDAGLSGNSVLLVDVAAFVNLLTGTTATGVSDTYLNYGLKSATIPVCTVKDPGSGIGTGAGQLNSLLCDASNATSTVAGATYNQHAFADRLYFTPAANRLIGDYVYNFLSGKWR